MNITLNDSESQQYIEYLDKMKAIVDIEAFIDVLKDIRLEVTPPVFRFKRENDSNWISWEYAVEVITERIKYLNAQLDKIINRYENNIP